MNQSATGDVEARPAVLLVDDDRSLLDVMRLWHAEKFEVETAV